MKFRFPFVLLPLWVAFPAFGQEPEAAAPATAEVEAEAPEPAAPETPAPSVVRFRTNPPLFDQLEGKLQSLTAETLVWDAPGVLRKPAAFRLDQVLDITLPAAMPELDADHEATVTLKRGGVVRGQLASVSDEKVELDTWYAGRLTFPRERVVDVRVDERPELVYRGPVGIAGWLPGSETPVWTCPGNVLHSSDVGGISREVEFPEKSRTRFDVEWRDGLQLRVVLLAKETGTDDPESGYEFIINRRSVQVRKGSNRMTIGQTMSATELVENERARIDLRVDRKAGKVAFYVNETCYGAWDDPDLDESEFGKGLHFIATSASRLKISQIEVSKWDGIAENAPEPNPGLAMRFGMMREPQPKKPEPEPLEEGRMLLRNGDSVAGEVLSIQDGLLTLKTKFSEMKLPVARLRSVTLKPVELEEAILRNGDVKAWFPDGSYLVFRLDAVSGDLITGSSQNFGSATFKMAAFSRIEFNLYDPELEQMRAGGAW